VVLFLELIVEGPLLTVAVNVTLMLTRMTLLGALREVLLALGGGVLAQFAPLRHLLVDIYLICGLSRWPALNDLLGEANALIDLEVVEDEVVVEVVDVDLVVPRELLAPIELSGLFRSIQITIGALRIQQVGVEVDDDGGLAGTDIETNEGAGVPAPLALLVIEGANNQELVVGANLNQAVLNEVTETGPC
jgi:hypothetical protein